MSSGKELALPTIVSINSTSDTVPYLLGFYSF